MNTGKKYEVTPEDPAEYRIKEMALYGYEHDTLKVELLVK